MTFTPHNTGNSLGLQEYSSRVITEMAQSNSSNELAAVTSKRQTLFSLVLFSLALSFTVLVTSSTLVTGST